MGRDQKLPAKIDRQFDGEPVHVGDRTVQPVGRITGKPIYAGGEQGSFSGVVAQLHPLEIVMCKGDETHTIPITDPQKESLRGIVMVGPAVGVGCILIMSAARYLAKRRLAS